MFFSASFILVSLSITYLLERSVNAFFLSHPHKAIKHNVFKKLSQSNNRIMVQKDENGYEVKPRDWFNGLSLDPGGSLTDPRAVPPEAREFAEAIKKGTIETTYQGTIDFLNKHYNYFEVR